MRSGLLRQRVTLQIVSEGTTDLFGQPLPDAWNDLAQVWGHIRYLSGVETIKAGGVASVVQASIRIRHRPGLSAAMRVVAAGQVYAVSAVLPDSGREYADLVCQVVT